VIVKIGDIFGVMPYIFLRWIIIKVYDVTSHSREA